MKIQTLYESVTADIITQLENGVTFWSKPWKDEKLHGIGLIPSNLVSGRLYSGGNIMLLWLTAQARGYQSLQFCTYTQVSRIGARVKKGEKATHVIFTKHTLVEDEKTGKEKGATVVKTYPVFNLHQLDAVPAEYQAPQQMPDQEHAKNEALLLSRGTGVPVTHGGNRAAYNRADDVVMMPRPSQFESEAAYFGTLMHEYTHASGHEKRLNRTFGKRFGDSAYAREELVAELGSAFLCARLGIQPSFRSAAYIQSWLKVLKEDSRSVFQAASYAGQASDWLWKQAFAED